MRNQNRYLGSMTAKDLTVFVSTFKDGEPFLPYHSQSHLLFLAGQNSSSFNLCAHIKTLLFPQRSGTALEHGKQRATKI